MKYLNNSKWSNWTRDERFFCSVLYQEAKKDEKSFGEWLCSETKIPFSNTEEWDLGYEVCFYRDYFWQKGDSARRLEYPTKRTFDLCLFNTNKIIIIEAKVFEQFESSQNNEFKKDKELIKGLEGFENIDVYTVALASSIYFENHKKHGKEEILEVFENRYLDWNRLFVKYGNDLFQKANQLYKSSPTFKNG